MNRIWPRLRFALHRSSRQTTPHHHLRQLSVSGCSLTMNDIPGKTAGAPNGAASAVLTDDPAPLPILENGNPLPSADRPPPPPDPLTSATYFASYDSLAALCANNIAYYSGDQSDTAQRSLAAYSALADHLATARTMADTIRQFAPEYDFDAHTRGNGYRSFLLVVRSCVAHSLQLSTYVMQNRGSLLFRRQLYVKEIEAASQLMASLCTCLRHLLTLRDWSAPGSLFPRDPHSAAELFDTAAGIDQYSFYGRCLGIQYCESMQSVVRVLAVAMAAFSEAYYKEGTAFRRTTASMWTSGKYYVNPELRARRIVNISQQAEIEFCKSFWSLTEGELMHALPNVLGTAVRVNSVVSVPAEPLRLAARKVATGGEAPEMIDIPVPSSHLGAGVNTIAARLLSASRRRGMMGAAAAATAADYKQKAKESSEAIIIHCHGGGFVAQSSKSHEMYLRDWAVALDVPIFSIDYSLAPAAPFPRAVEEVFYAYCWALHNCELLGTSAKRVVLAGDSAGANLCLAAAIRCIEAGVRVPDGIFLAYCPVRISFDPSPARLLCLMDPLLPFGFMMRCLKAYACPNATIIAENSERVAEMERVRGAQGAGTVGAAGAETLKRSDTMQSVSLTAGTFVDVGEASAASPLEGAGGSSLWEHIENDFAAHERGRSSMAAGEGAGLGVEEEEEEEDGASDTFASASLRSQSSAGGNTDMMTPDESNGESLEEDSQPITLHRSMRNGGAEAEAEAEPEENGNSAAKSSLLDGAKLEDDDDEELVVLERQPSVAKETAAAPAIPSIPSTTRREETIVLDAGRDALSVQNIQQKIIQVMDSVASSVTARLQAMTASTPIRECQEFAKVRQQLDAEEARDPTEEFVFEIPRDPLLSPYWASDEVLAQMPQTHILTVDMDPCLDDCVMFARRLKELGRPVEMDILAGLPHGFLNFVKLSKEAHAGNKVCVKRLAQLLNVPDTSA